MLINWLSGGMREEAVHNRKRKQFQMCWTKNLYHEISFQLLNVEANSRSKHW